MIRLSTVQWQCDWCGQVSAERELAPSGVIAETITPEGWQMLGHAEMRVLRANGLMVNALCPACGAKPARALLEWLRTSDT